MAEKRYDDYEEYYAQFIRIDGERGTVLIFGHDEKEEKLADEIMTIIDKKVD